MGLLDHNVHCSLTPNVSIDEVKRATDDAHLVSCDDTDPTRTISQREDRPILRGEFGIVAIRATTACMSAPICSMGDHMLTRTSEACSRAASGQAVQAGADLYASPTRASERRDR